MGKIFFCIILTDACGQFLCRNLQINAQAFGEK